MLSSNTVLGDILDMSCFFEQNISLHNLGYPQSNLTCWTYIVIYTVGLTTVASQAYNIIYQL